MTAWTDVTLLASRDELYAVLGAAGLETAESGGQRVAVPGVIVSPADPWVESMRTGLAERAADQLGGGARGGAHRCGGSLAQLSDLIESTWAALAPLAGTWTVPAVSAPRVINVNGTDYSGAVLRLSRLISLGAEV